MRLKSNQEVQWKGECSAANELGVAVSWAEDCSTESKFVDCQLIGAVIIADIWLQSLTFCSHHCQVRVE